MNMMAQKNLRRFSRNSKSYTSATPIGNKPAVGDCSPPRLQKQADPCQFYVMNRGIDVASLGTMTYKNSFRFLPVRGPFTR